MTRNRFMIILRLILFVTIPDLVIILIRNSRPSIDCVRAENIVGVYITAAQPVFEAIAVIAVVARPSAFRRVSGGNGFGIVSKQAKIRNPVVEAIGSSIEGINGERAVERWLLLLE